MNNTLVPALAAGLPQPPARRAVGWLASVLLTMLAVMVGPADVRADFLTTFTNEHVDVDLHYEGGALAIGWHDETNDVEYEANEALVRIDANGLRLRPSSSAFNFIGVPAGAPVWILPQVQNPNLVFLGLGAEEIDPGLFENDEVTLTLIAVRGPGFFSMYSTDAFGNPTVFMASADGVSSADQIVFPTGSHQDFNWAFTAGGFYELDFQLSGTLVGGQVIQSEVTTLSVSVVPEPASWGLLALGAGPLLLRMWRKRRN